MKTIGYFFDNTKKYFKIKEETTLMRYVRSVILTNLHAEHIVGSVLDSYLYAGAFIDRRALKSTRMSVHTSEISISTRTYAGAVPVAILVNSQSAGLDTFVCLCAVKKKYSYACAYALSRFTRTA